MRKQLIKIIMLVFAVVMITGCGEPAQEAENPEIPWSQPTDHEVSNPAELTSEEEDEKTYLNIRIAHFALSNDAQTNPDLAGLRHSITKWDADNPDIILNQEIIGRDNYNDFLKEKLSEDNLPDLFLVDESELDYWIESGRVLLYGSRFSVCDEAGGVDEGTEVDGAAEATDATDATEENDGAEETDTAEAAEATDNTEAADILPEYHYVFAINADLLSEPDKLLTLLLLANEINK